MEFKKEYFLLSLIFIVIFLACNNPYASKKTGFFKIDLPARGYKLFDEPGFPYSFEYPVYANIVRDSTYFDTSAENNYWRNIDFPASVQKYF